MFLLFLPQSSNNWSSIHQFFVRHVASFSPVFFPAEAMSIWKSCDAVCFDVDSTVIQQEGIDELAAYVGKEKEVAAL